MLQGNFPIYFFSFGIPDEILGDEDFGRSVPPVVIRGDKPPAAEIEKEPRGIAQDVRVSAPVILMRM